MNLEPQAFLEAFRKTMQHEGENSNHPKDSGGATRFGISQKFLQSISKSEVSPTYIYSLTLDDAREIYRTYFWEKTGVWRVKHWLVREALFDQCVNRGQRAAIESLQNTVNRMGCSLKVDGILGKETAKAVGALPEAGLLKSFVKDCQLSYVRICQKDETQIVFLSGWINRTWNYF